MSKDEQISFQVEIPEDSDIEHIMYRIQDVANSVVYDSDKETITGIVSEENKLQLIRYLRSEALQHNLELKKTFWHRLTPGIFLPLAIHNKKEFKVGLSPGGV